MRGDVIRELQLTLRHNPFGTFDPGERLGIFDEDTAAAVRRAKYWLGFPESRIDGEADLQLLDLLTGERPLPPSWAASRRKRLRRVHETVLWHAALDIAREEMQSQAPWHASRVPPAKAWYGVDCPWSVVFPCYCYAQAGSRSFAPRRTYAYAPYLLDEARRGNGHLSVTTDPLRGDIAMIDQDGGGAPDRAALFDGWDREGQFYDAIEGDVGREGQLDGSGSIARTRRSIVETVAFVHVRA
jgi:hypothetical protein